MDKQSYLQKVKYFLLCAFFLSGCISLIYQLVWGKYLILTFGSTVGGVSSVVGSFMAGLGLGAFLGGKLSDKFPQKTLLLYGLTEILIGSYVVASSYIFPFILNIYSFIYSSHLNFSLLITLRFCLAFLCLILPTMAMGATLPLGIKTFSSLWHNFKNDVGKLYGINTIGAAFGAFIGGFFLLPLFGLKTSLFLGATINIGIGVFALSLALEKKRSIIPSEVIKVHPFHSPSLFWLSIAYGLCGLSSMIYEICWTRALALIIGSSTYAFSSMLTIYIIGLGMGSYVFTRFYLSKREPSFFCWGILQLILAIYTIFSIPLINQLPYFFISFSNFVSKSNFLLFCIYFLCSIIIIFIPTFIIGALFPLVTSLYKKEGKENEGESVGVVYGVNTIGCVIGTFLTGIILLPCLGAGNTLKLASFINLLLGIVLVYLFSFGKLKRRFLYFSLILLYPLLCLPELDKELLSKGVSIYLPSRDRIKHMLNEIKLLYYKDGSDCTVTVEEIKSSKIRILKVNGKIDASDKKDMPNQLLQAYIPLLYLSSPKEALVIGLGSGVTAGALGISHVEKVTAVEIESAIVKCIPLFSHVNHELHKNKKVKIIIEDGRSYLKAAVVNKNFYNLIVSVPSNPWVTNVANLFTTEYYKLCLSSLTEDGVMAQWVQLYRLFPQDFLMILNTFYSVFPYGTIWFAGEGDVLLIGGKQPLSLKYSNIENLFANPLINKDLKSIGIVNPLKFISYFLTDKSQIKKVIQRYKCSNTDDLNLLEYNAPKSLYIYTTTNNLAALELLSLKPPDICDLSLTKKDLAEYYYYLAEYNLQNNFISEALWCINLSIKYNPKNALHYFLRAQIHLLLQKILLAEDDFEYALKLKPNFIEAKLSLAKLYHSQEIYNKAYTLFLELYTQMPNNSEILNILKDLQKKLTQEENYDYNGELSEE